MKKILIIILVLGLNLISCTIGETYDPAVTPEPTQPTEELTNDKVYYGIAKNRI